MAHHPMHPNRNTSPKCPPCLGELCNDACITLALIHGNRTHMAPNLLHIPLSTETAFVTRDTSNVLGILDEFKKRFCDAHNVRNGQNKFVWLQGHMESHVWKHRRRLLPQSSSPSPLGPFSLALLLLSAPPASLPSFLPACPCSCLRPCASSSPFSPSSAFCPPAGHKERVKHDQCRQGHYEGQHARHAKHIGQFRQARGTDTKTTPRTSGPCRTCTFLGSSGINPHNDLARILPTLMDTVPCKEARGAGRRCCNSS